MKITAGDLNRCIEIFKQVETADSTGQRIITWESLCCVFAKRYDNTSLRDTETKMDDLQRVSTGLTQWTIRYRSDLNSRMKIVEDGIDFMIVGEIMTMGLRQWTVVNTEQRDTRGF